MPKIPDWWSSQSKRIGREPLFPAELDYSLWEHYNGTSEELNEVMPQLIKLRNNPKYAPYLEVPSKYKRAYRLLTCVTADAMKNLLGKRPRYPGFVVIRNGTYKPRAKISTSSWTVDAKIFNTDHKGIAFARAPGTKEHYVVLAEADLSGHRDSFIGNPDKLIHAVSHTVRERKFLAHQSEIIGYGPIPLVAMHYCRVDPAIGYNLQDYLSRIQPKLSF